MPWPANTTATSALRRFLEPTHGALEVQIAHILPQNYDVKSAFLNISAMELASQPIGQPCCILIRRVAYHQRNNTFKGVCPRLVANSNTAAKNSNDILAPSARSR
jgi:hypothetical protein